MTTETGSYRVTVTATDEATKSIVQNPRGYTGTVSTTIFTFDANATGRLSFIANTVAAYKDQIYKDRTDKVIAWEWK